MGNIIEALNEIIDRYDNDNDMFSQGIVEGVTLSIQTIVEIYYK